MTRDEFIAENMGLVRACARRFAGRGAEYDDLFQVGCLGLVKAADRFDPGRGLCFSTYAVPVILGEMRRLFRDGGTVKVSRRLKELSLKANRFCDDFSAREGRAPLLHELAEALNIDEAEAAAALEAGRPALSLTQSGEEGGEAPVVLDAPEEEITDRLSLQQAVDALEEKDRQLLRARYVERKTQAGVAAALGMTQVQVSRREKKILQRLRELLG